MLDAHDKLVARVTRILWFLGFFCRSNVPVDLIRWVPEEAKSRTRISIADIDILGIKYDADFVRRTTIVEAKTGDLKPVDRILWLRGLMDYFKASDAYLVPLKEEEAFSEVSRGLGIQLVNAPKMTELEKSLGVDTSVFGPYDPLIIEKRREFYAELKKTKARAPLYYVTFRAWEDNPPYMTLKAVIGQGKNLAEYLDSKLSVAQSEKWLAYELLIMFSISLLNYASLFRGFSYSDHQKFEDEVKRVVSHGRLNPREMSQMTGLFYDLMAAYVKTKFNKALDIKKEDLFDIEPRYASDLAEVVFRIMNSPKESTEVPRALEVVGSALSSREENAEPKNFQRLLPGLDISKTVKLAENDVKLFCTSTGLGANLYADLGEAYA